MPCNSDHMNQTGTEAYNQRTAKLFLYITGKLNTPDAAVREAADTYYCTVDYTENICTTLRRLKRRDPKMFNEIVYNAKSKTSRDLADWWEEHVLADRKRLDSEKSERARKRLIKSALNKLTPAERKALRKR